MADKVASFRMDGGLITDRPAIAVPPNIWTAASNIKFSQLDRIGVAARISGHAATWATPATDVAPQFGLNVDSYGAASRTATNYRWYGGIEYATGYARIGQQLAGVDSDVTPASWVGAGDAAPGRWTGGILNNFVPVLNDQVHIPAYYDIIAALWQDLPVYNPTGAGVGSWTALRVYREYLIGMGLLIAAGSYRSDTVYWSVPAAYNAPPTTWISAATNQAGDAVLPGGGEIVDGAVLGEDFLIYKQFSSYKMTYTGGNYVMAVRPMFKGWGAWSQNCIAEYGGKHYVFNGRDLLVTDGQRWESALYGKVRSLITLDPTHRRKSFIWIDKQRRELWLCMVQSGQTVPGNAIVVDMDSGLAGYRAIPSLTGMVHESQENLTAPIGLYTGTGAANSGLFYNMFTGSTFDGSDFTSTITRERLQVAGPGRLATVKWVRPWLDSTGTPSVTVEVAGTMNTDITPSYGTAITFTIGTTDKADIPFSQGRFHSFRFSATSGVGWNLTGFDVGYEDSGAF